ncbi:MAG: protoheme IX farnesyltransferase [Chloroflexi bacterium]|nr:protoheme IX farnesyltransferase [Chloroflexota bacterium]
MTASSHARRGGLLALLLASVVAVFLLVTVGGVVRVTGSGLGCPDWPLCYGNLFPPLEYHALLEYTHRLVAALSSPLLLLTAGVGLWRYRYRRQVVVPLTAAVGLLGVELALGGITVLTELPPAVVTVHLAMAEGILALLLVTLVWTWVERPVPVAEARRLVPWALAAAGAGFFVLLSGSYVVGEGAGATCSAWPLCDGGWLPSSGPAWLHMGHRLLAGVVGILIGAAALLSWQRRKSSRALGYAGAATAFLFLAQVLAGAANPWTAFAPAAKAVHLSLSTALWGSAVVLAALVWRPAFLFPGRAPVGAATTSSGGRRPDQATSPPEGLGHHPVPAVALAGASVLASGPPAEPAAARGDGKAPAISRPAGEPGRDVLIAAGGTGRRQVLRSLRTVALDYVTLTKPRITLLLLWSSLAGMVLAAQGVPGLSVTLVVLVGGALGAGGANAINHYLDRDLDERMTRTRRRPVPARRVSPVRALVFGVVLSGVAFAVMALGANLLSAVLTLGAGLFYVLVYTLWLKRSTPQNIVIGGAAGAMPPVVGWAAVTGSVELPALYLFAVVFFWTPPHFWALALLLRGDYARAGVPMLPVVAGVKETARSILLHTVLLVTTTLLFAAVGKTGPLYLASALVLGAVFLGLAWRLFRGGGNREARHLYRYSLLYLGLLWAVIMAESALRAP